MLHADAVKQRANNNQPKFVLLTCVSASIVSGRQSTFRYQVALISVNGNAQKTALRTEALSVAPQSNHTLPVSLPAYVLLIVTLGKLSGHLQRSQSLRIAYFQQLQAFSEPKLRATTAPCQLVFSHASSTTVTFTMSRTVFA